MIPKQRAHVVTLGAAQANKSREAIVLAVVDEDGMVTDVYCTWTACGGGYVATDRVGGFSWSDYEAVQDLIPRAAGEEQIDARHASKWTSGRARVRVEHTRQKPARIRRHI